MDLYSGSIISLVLFLNPLFTTPSFLFALFAALQTLLIHLKIVLYHHTQISFTFMHPKKFASQCQIKAIVAESKMQNRTFVNVEPHLPIIWTISADPSSIYPSQLI